ncbi:energy-coupled thiamine transporter ThiT [Staphylospora marina]|uniref:energy-coupled thiamine transporter ThiT n=1 Tax=Staphylospora marina TaxID=2490858 RepID=UPI000F5BFFBB|nr:energy-coupled thiamine transporter ThiT [Staphylospora marina]
MKRLGVIVEAMVLVLLAAVFHRLLSFPLVPETAPVSLMAVPVSAAAFRRGVKTGMITGLLAGALVLLAGTIPRDPGPLDWIVPPAAAAWGWAGAVPVRETRGTASRLITGGIGLLLGAAVRFLALFGGVKLFAGPTFPMEWLWFVLAELLAISLVVLPLLVRAPGLLARRDGKTQSHRMEGGGTEPWENVG